MKLVTYDAGEGARPGVLLDQGSLLEIRDHASIRALLDAGPEAMEALREQVEASSQQSGVPLAQYTLLSPLQPGSLRDFMAFEAHIVQATRAVIGGKLPPLAALDACWEKKFGKALIGAPKVWYQRPVYYTGNPRSVIGPDAELRWPSFTRKLDFEFEWAVVIGREGRDIPVERAREYIAGYTIFNDFSARDVQMEEMKGRLGPAKSKNFDTANALGPWLVTADEFPSPYQLSMTARVNDEVWCEGSTNSMHYLFEDIIAYLSQDETLYPGDVLGSGTVGGGCGLELDRWIQPGDVIELEVEGLGVLRNTVGHPPAASRTD